MDVGCIFSRMMQCVDKLGPVKLNPILGIFNTMNDFYKFMTEAPLEEKDEILKHLNVSQRENLDMVF